MAQEAILPSSLRRVYLVSWWFADTGGMERHIAELANSLRSRGIQVTVFTEMPVPRSNQYRRELRQAGISFVCPPLPRRLVEWWQRRFPVKATGGTSRPDSKCGDDVSSAMGTSFLARWLKFNLQRAARRGTPDVVHVHGWLLKQWVIAWCASRGIPSVYTEHSTIADWGGPAIAQAPRFIAGAGAIACVSEAARRSLSQWLPNHSIVLHPHIVRAPALARPDPASTHMRILCVARLRAEKGLDILLRAAALLRRRGNAFQLEIAGDGPQLAELRSLAGELGLQDSVMFSGLSLGPAIHEKMRNANLFVIPSRTEGMPLALLEAMSHSLPVVATAVGGIPEVVIAGETGLLAPPESVESLAGAIEHLIRDSALRAKLGANARRQFESGPYCSGAALQNVLSSYERARSGGRAE